MAAALQPVAVHAQSTIAGDQVFEAKCVRCHGDHGQGSEKNPKQLAGDLSVTQLAAVIFETMPEDDPGTLDTEEADAIAAYIHDAFYSPIARARNRPARIDLSRLTVRQYRQSVADLIGGFTGVGKWDEDRGLMGEYFASREPGGDKQRKERRTDAVVDFDFGTEAPVPDIGEPRRYSIRWSGSLLAPDTGDYEFIIRTDHAARLWINDNDTPLIDAWVKSGDDTEYTAKRYLVGGRVYGVRLEFTKAKQGVDDSDKEKDKDKEKPPSAPASVALWWRRPQSAPEVLPARFLSPADAPEAFVSTSPFPPDDRSLGWERGAAVSKEWDEATTNAAIEALGYITDHINRLARTKDDAKDRSAKLRAFCINFAERAFREPLDDALEHKYVDDQFDSAEDSDAALRRVVLMVLKSPRFLFRDLEEVPAFATAARLSFGLWNSLPDNDLLKAARLGKLETESQVRHQAEWMLRDGRAKAKLADFLLTWLHLDAGADLTKDPKTFPEFDDTAIGDVRTSLEMFLDEVLSSDGADYRRLLLDDEVYLNERLARIYGVPWDEKSRDFRKVRLNDGERAGVLTHPYVMARYAYSSESSPIHRGVFLARGVLGRTLRPPPNAFVPLEPDLHPDMTTRERVALQTQAVECMSCHGIINPLGFTLEHFDAVGRYRETDRGKQIDPTATYEAPDGATVTLHGARELAEYLAGSEDCHEAFVEQLFHHLVQQPVAAYGPDTLEKLNRSFAEHDYNIRQLAAEIMVATAMVRRETNEAAASHSQDASPAALSRSPE